MAEINAVKKKAYSVLKQYKHRNLSLEDLVHLADENGFTVLDYSKTSEESDTETIIKELGLSSFAKTGNSFVYKNKDIKLIFLNEAMSAEEKRYSLAHELGHVLCGHLKNSACCKEAEIEEEHEANEFAHFLLHPGPGGKVMTAMASHKVATLIVAIMLICVLISIPIIHQIQKTRLFYGEYYVTENGEKYHLGECPIIKDKTNTHRLTIEEYESGKYLPCQVCLPDGETVEEEQP